jgi:hypothetical protein
MKYLIALTVVCVWMGSLVTAAPALADPAPEAPDPIVTALHDTFKNNQKQISDLNRQIAQVRQENQDNQCAAHQASLGSSKHDTNAVGSTSGAAGYVPVGAGKIIMPAYLDPGTYNTSVPTQ